MYTFFKIDVLVWNHILNTTLIQLLMLSHWNCPSEVQGKVSIAFVFSLIGQMCKNISLHVVFLLEASAIICFQFSHLFHLYIWITLPFKFESIHVCIVNYTVTQIFCYHHHFCHQIVMIHMPSLTVWDKKGNDETNREWNGDRKEKQSETSGKAKHLLINGTVFDRQIFHMEKSMVLVMFRFWYYWDLLNNVWFLHIKYFLHKITE